ncbi:MAG: TIM44-like domain-containing protein [Planctomycetes bacterium]|nr:TIM44-like domain-containing protein [Planctomycetota bacterium]
MVPSPFTTHALAVAQAGGGGSFGGGGGGGGGHGGDSDGGLALEAVFWLIRLAIEVPVVGVPLILVLVIVLVVGTRRGWWKHQERVIRRRAPAIEARRAAQRAEVRLTGLRERDPAFDDARFLARAQAAFSRAQSAWCAQDLEPLRPFVSDGVFERFSLQIEEQREQGWRQGMDALRVGAPWIQHVEEGRRFDTIVVRIPFEADVHRRELANGRRIAGSELPRGSFEECWSFVRRRGAKTSGAAGLIEGACPNCGAPLAMNQSALCASCGVLVQSGEFDWVLAEITQASEWRADDERSVRGFAELSERDPALALQLLEDRASVAFWRWTAAQRLGRVEPLVRVADPALCERTAAEFAEGAKGPRLVLVDRAVGSVRTLGLLAADAGERALVEVVWDGRPVSLAPGVSPPRGAADDRRALRRTLFVLARPLGVATSDSEAFTSTRCRKCGARDAGGTEARCPYCAAPRTGDASAWLVTAIAPVEGPAGRAWIEELARVPPAGTAPPRPSTAGLLAWMLAAARADGTIHHRERRAVARLGAGFGVRPEHVDALLEQAESDELAPLPRDADEARAWLSELCALALVDGVLHHAELALLRRAARRFGIETRELDVLLAAKRSELYREAR